MTDLESENKYGKVSKLVGSVDFLTAEREAHRRIIEALCTIVGINSYTLQPTGESDYGS